MFHGVFQSVSRWLSHLFQGRKEPVPQHDTFSELTWLEPAQNPFGLRVLDCRPFCTSFLSMTKDPAIATRFGQLRHSRGEEHRGQHPVDPLVVSCELSYPFNGESREGPLFLAQQMEDKWDIFLYDGHLYFARSWTGELVFRAKIEFRQREAVITTIESNRAKGRNDPVVALRTVDFLMKSHLYRQEAPHPLPQWFPPDTKIIALHSFSEFGRWGFFASFEDTTKVRVREGPECPGGSGDRKPEEKAG